MNTRVAERCPNCEAGSGEPGQHCGGPSRNCSWWRCPSCRATISPEAYFLSAERTGRWPTNVVLDESQAAELDRQSGHQKDGVAVKRNRDGKPQGVSSWALPGEARPDQGYGGQGGASRFFPTFRYQAKAPTRERPRVNGVAHPTVKPLDLMRWLVRLVTPPGGTVLDPFAGSGTTGEACLLEHLNCILIEREEDYLPLIVQRVIRTQHTADTTPGRTTQ